MSGLKMLWSNCVTIFIIIIGMYCQYTNSMKITEKTTVTKNFEAIKNALNLVQNDNSDTKLYSDATLLLENIFVRQFSPHDYINISINKRGRGLQDAVLVKKALRRITDCGCIL